MIAKKTADNSDLWIKIFVCSVFGFGLLIALASCKGMSRFEQETFSCGLNATGIVEIIIRSIQAGEDAILTTVNGEMRMPITHSSDNLITISDGQTNIVIDRHTKMLEVTIADKVYYLECKSSIFKM